MVILGETLGSKSDRLETRQIQEMKSQFSRMDEVMSMFGRFRKLFELRRVCVCLRKNIKWNTCPLMQR